LLNKSAQLARDAGDLTLVPSIVHGLGDAALAAGDLARAASHYRDSLSTAHDLAYGRGIAFSVAGIAAVAAARGQLERAGRLWGGVEVLERSAGTPVLGNTPIYQTLIDSCSDAAPTAFAAAAERGRRMGLDDIYKYALATD
jgi:hypothetical protein